MRCVPLAQRYELHMKKKYKPWFIIGNNGGQVPLKRQLLGLSTIEVERRTVLDLGCAEGLTSIHMAERGATLVHGVELRERAVEVGNSLVGFNGMSDRVRFYHGDLRYPQKALAQPGMLEQYDVVFAMASIQKLKSKAVPAMKLLTELCASTFVVRLPKPTIPAGFGKTRAVSDILTEHGFEMKWESCGHPQGDPPYPMEGGSWLAEFVRIKCG